MKIAHRNDIIQEVYSGNVGRGSRKAAENTGFKKRQGMKVSFFERFVSKEVVEQEKKPVRPKPYKKLYAELEASAAELKERYPEDSKTVDDFLLSLKKQCKARSKEAENGDLQPMKAEARFFLAEDRMSAYACLLRPENGGEDLPLERFMGDMRYEGIHYGVVREDVQKEFERGYFRIFPVARGKAPTEGEDGKVTELLQRQKYMSVEAQSGSQVDFSQDTHLQAIRKGMVICLIRLPREGTDGMDVTGQRLPSPEPKSAKVPQGKNTVISRGGQALTAAVDGIVYMEDDRFCVHEQKVVDGDLDQFQGTLRVFGNLYIEGNVDGGVEVEASGEIVINGKMGQARVISTSGTIRVQKGIYGTEGKTFVKASGQVQAPVIEWAEVEGGTSVIAETISNSVIRCGGTVYVMNGRGMIVDSTIRAGASILCQRVGNLAGGRSSFSVGYPPHIPEAWERIKAEQAEVQSTLEKLWGPITSMRRKGTRISEEEKQLLEQLVEQRELYFKRQEDLMAELKTLNKSLDKKSRGKIRCEKLYPSLDVRIGKLTEEITTEEEGCSIHVEENRMLLR